MSGGTILHDDCWLGGAWPVRAAVRLHASGPISSPPTPACPTKRLRRAGRATRRLPAPPIRHGGRVSAIRMLTGLEQRVADANLDVRTATIRAGGKPVPARRDGRGANSPASTATPRSPRELYSKNGILSLLAPLGPPGAAASTSRRSTNITSASTPPGSSTSGAGSAGRSRRPTPQVDSRPRTSAATRWSRPGRSRARLHPIARRPDADRDRQGKSGDRSRISCRSPQERQRKGPADRRSTVENAAAQVESVRAQIPAAGAAGIAN